MIARLIADDARNELVVQTVRETRGRRSLVLSERVDHCLHLAAALAARGVAAEALVGKLDDERRRQVLARFGTGDGGVLVATTALVGEGFDCPELDTLYLTVPSANVARVTQALGRVLRPLPGKDVARVFDFVDVATPGLARKLAQRLKVYRSHGIRSPGAAASPMT
jgi:superfamily II DNA or RNA helicase